MQEHIWLRCAHNVPFLHAVQVWCTNQQHKGLGTYYLVRGHLKWADGDCPRTADGVVDGSKGFKTSHIMDPLGLAHHWIVDNVSGAPARALAKLTMLHATFRAECGVRAQA